MLINPDNSLFGKKTMEAMTLLIKWKLSLLNKNFRFDSTMITMISIKINKQISNYLLNLSP